MYGGEEATTNVEVSAAVLESVRLEPDPVQVPIGIEQKIRLWGVYSDRTERDLTDVYTLTIVDESVAGIQSQNVVKGRSLGETTITGAYGGFSANAQLTTIPAIPVFLKIVPSEIPVTPGMSRHFCALATLSDGTIIDVTDTVNWNTQDPIVATVAPGGLVEALKVGSTLLEATLNELNAKHPLEVVLELDSPWKTNGGNLGRTGENLTETAGPPTSLLWQHAFAPAPTNTVFVNPVVSARGVVYVTYYIYSREHHLFALDAATGNQLWSFRFPSGISSVGEPTYDDGKVYVAQCDHSTNSFMWCFDAVSGDTVWVSPMSVQWPRFWAPLVVEGGVFSQSGYYGGIQGWDADTGRERFVERLEQTDNWSPSYYRGKVYSLARNILRAHDPISGAVLDSYLVANNTEGGRYSFPALADGAAYVINDGDLYKIAVEAGVTSWTATGFHFRGVAAVSEGVVYGISAGSLIALDAANGDWLWNFAGDNSMYHLPIIAGDYIYVSSNANTYAVNRRTRSMAWTVAHGGKLSVADGRLFILNSDGVLKVYQLQD